jgi:hypothetical protein
MSAPKKTARKAHGGAGRGQGRKPRRGGRKVAKQIVMYPAVWDLLEDVAHRKGISLGDCVMHALLPPHIIAELDSPMIE